MFVLSFVLELCQLRSNSLHGFLAHPSGTIVAALGAVCSQAADGVIANFEPHPAKTELDAQKTASPFLLGLCM